MTLIKTSLLNGIAVLVKMLTMLGLNKLLAVYVGPAGYAAIGQFQNVVSIVTAFASGAVNTGVIKYTAEYYDDDSRQRTVWRTAGTLSISGTMLGVVVLILFHQPLAVWVFKREDFGSVFLWLAASLMLFVLNGLLLAILNGKKEVHRYVGINIAGSLIGAGITALLAWSGGLYGALVAYSINQSVVFFVTLAVCYRTTWFRLRDLWGKMDGPTLRNLAKFTLMALTSAATIPVSHLLVRNHLGGSFGWEAAGYWQAVWKISEIYLLLVTSTLSLYYLPRLSEIRNPHELKREIWQGYRLILPVATLGAGTIYSLRDWIVPTLFTAEFAPMRELFAWQLTGDVIKIGSWLLAYVMVAKAMTKLFILTEIAFAAIFVGLTWFFTTRLGMPGVTVAYCVTYLLYWLVMLIIVHTVLTRRETELSSNVVCR